MARSELPRAKAGNHGGCASRPPVAQYAVKVRAAERGGSERISPRMSMKFDTWEGCGEP